MAGGGSEDPFFWGVDRLVQELCTPQRTWDAPVQHKLPDPTKLRSALEEHELDGQDLLTYEDKGGREAFDSLCKDLGIKKIPHKSSLHDAIRQFQRRSNGYRQWKKKTLDKLDQSSDIGMAKAVTKGGTGPTTAASTSPQQNGVGSLRQPPAAPNGDFRSLNGPAHESESSIEERPAKRKRLAPVNIGPASAQPRAAEVPTEADVVGQKTEDQDLMLQLSRPGAYLGHSKVTKHSILQREVGSTMADQDDGPEVPFCSMPRAIPPGRRLQVYQIIRRRLAPMKPQLNLGRSRMLLEEEEDPEEVLPAFGDSDDEYDSDTWAEIEEEAAERQNLANAKSRFLSSEEIDTIITDAIKAIEDRWTLKKLPKLEKSAYRVWTESRRQGRRKLEIDRASGRVEELENRIAKFTKGMHRSTWKKKKDVEETTPVFEQTVADKLHQEWLANLLRSPTQPKKPETTKATKWASRPKKIKVRTVDDEEILTSDSEDGFIVDDPNDAMEIDTSPRARLGNFQREREPNATESDGDSDVVAIGSRDITPQQGAEKAIPVSSPRHWTKADLLASKTVVADASGGALNAVDASSTVEQCPFGNILEITRMGVEHWEKVHDPSRLVITMLSNLDSSKRRRLFSHLGMSYDELWEKLCAHAIKKRHHVNTGKINTPRSVLDDAAFTFTRLFDAFTTVRCSPASSFFPLNDDTVQSLELHKSDVSEFYALLQQVIHFYPEAASLSLKAAKIEGEGVDNVDDMDDMGSDDEEEPVEAKSTDASPSKKRKRRVRRDKAAQNLRDYDRARLEKQDERRKALREKLALSSSMSEGESRLIINETKEDNQGLIYVNNVIGAQIKDHQIEGVRFMWNQTVADPTVRQGCLLAHTMGLGKTMQVITLLVAIAEASASDDPSIYEQIPLDLRESRTLILCPSGLLGNWGDEIDKWAPSSLLGDIRKIDAELAEEARAEEVRIWASDGGVLIIGYTMFRKLMGNKEAEDLRPLLEESPNIVIADEAHQLKNPNSQIHKVSGNFRTKTRIAMTGSPLANSVEEYHSMINWVAPNYLADHAEFVSVFAKPIREGFYKDSHAAQKRKAQRMLRVLKDTVAPKIHRITMTAMKAELPPKKEFILYLPISTLQRQAYKVFIDHITRPANLDTIKSNVALFNLIHKLGNLLAHPKVFQTRLKAELGGHDAEDKRTAVSLTREAISDLLAVVNGRDIDDVKYSAKVMILLAILDEARRVGDKVLVFTQSLPVLDFLEALLRRHKRRFCRLDGSTRVNQRQSMVKNFNTGKDEVYLISTTAGGVGLNIHGANRVVVFDFKWNPVHEQQAIGRAYRIGQTKPVFVYWLIVGGTYETIMHNQAVFKTQLASRVVDKKNPLAWSQQLKEYTQPPRDMPAEPTQGYLGKDVILDALLNSEVGKDLNLIRKIITTDTFEEEGTDDVLSAEDLKETEDMVRLHFLRLNNPQEYQREIAQKQAPTAVPTLKPGPPAASGQPISQNIISPSTLDAMLVDQAQTASPKEAVKLRAPAAQLRAEALDRERAKALEQAQASKAQAYSLSPSLPNPSQSSTPATQGQRKTGKAARYSMLDPAERRSASPPTFSPSDPTSYTSKTLGNALHAAAGTQPPRQSPDSAAKVYSGSADGFQTAMAGVAAGIPHAVLGLPADSDKLAAIAKVAADVGAAFTRQKIAGLPAMSQWGQLTQLAAHANFVSAVLSGYIPPDTLALLSRDGLVRVMQNYMASAKGQRNTDDPNHIQTVMERKVSRAAPQSSADMEAIESVVRQREGRGPRLPGWAREASTAGSQRRRSGETPGPAHASPDLQQGRRKSEAAHGKAKEPKRAKPWQPKIGDAKDNPFVID